MRAYESPHQTGRDSACTHGAAVLEQRYSALGSVAKRPRSDCSKSASTHTGRCQSCHYRSCLEGIIKGLLRERLTVPRALTPEASIDGE